MEPLTYAVRSRWRYLLLIPLVLLVGGPQVVATVTSGLSSLLISPFTHEIEFAANRYEIFNAQLLLIYIVVALGLNLVFQAGMISLGHSAFFLVGAYSVGLLTQHGLSFWLALVVGLVLAAVLGLLLGAPAIRLGLFTLAMVTLGYAIVAQDMVLEWRGLTGGGDGLRGIERPAPFAGLDQYYWLVAVCVVLVYLFTRNWLRSPLGRAGRATADNEVAAGSIRIDVRVVKVRSFVVSAAIAGLAGGLYAPLIGFLSPRAFTVDLAVLFLLMVLLGGGGTAVGPIIGAVVLFRIPLAVEDVTGSAGNVSLLVYGVVLVIAVRLLPQGFMSGWWLLRGWLERRFGGRATEGPAAAEFDGTAFAELVAAGAGQARGPRLRAVDLRKQLGGVKAVDGVGIEVEPGEVHAIIGPNGSGKTTTLNLLSGYVEPDGGTFELDGERVRSGGTVRARHGLGRTFQTPLLFSSMTCLENVMVALDGRTGVPRWAGLLRLPHARAAERRDHERAVAILAAVGIRDVDTRASVLPPGRRRLLEIARLIAFQPRIVLMDEPAAGLTHAEIEHLETMIAAFAAAGIGVVLVEHHVDLVLRLATRVTVLDFGKVLASGTPEEIRNDPKVLEAYLGTSLQANEGDR